jgi:hypothetical protein
VFLLPLLTGIAGAFLAGHFGAGRTPTSTGWWQFLGMIAGLILGVTLAKLVVRLCRQEQSCPHGGEE